MKDERVYACPNTPQVRNTSFLGFGAVGTSYSINAMLAGPMGSPITFLRLNQIRHSSSTFVFIERWDVEVATWWPEQLCGGRPFTYWLYKGPQSAAIPDIPGQNHKPGLLGSGGCTVSFADGHAMFWQYVDPVTSRLGQMVTTSSLQPAMDSSSTYTDGRQLQAWSGGPVPPGYY